MPQQKTKSDGHKALISIRRGIYWAATTDSTEMGNELRENEIRNFLDTLARWLNTQGFRTRNRHKLSQGTFGPEAEPRMFTTASVRGILHNPFFTGRVKHREQLLPGVHESLVSTRIFDAVQTTMKKNSGRSETLHPRPEREYLLKGLIRCAHCGLPMWAQTYKNGNRYYREHPYHRYRRRRRAETD